MDIIVQCKRCGEKYHKRNGKTKYCPDCRKAAAKEGQAEWRKKHPGYMKRWREQAKA